MRKTVVINAVGLTQRLISSGAMQWVGFGEVARVGTVVPAVTCPVQATYLTGAWPCEHGIVGNGWYDRVDCEIKFWKQSDKLVQRPRVWDLARQRDPSFTCANICWWYAMYSSCDYTVTPRPMYLADGRKIPDIWTSGPKWLRSWLQDNLGPFPLFKFWGPAANIESTRWIADAAIEIDLEFHPTLSLIYLPHLDYALQRGDPVGKALGELDEVIGQLLNHFEKDARIIIFSEYGISPVSRPVHLNRVLREHDLLAVRDELGRELLDPGASVAFAVADHQVAHVYVNDPARVDHVASILKKTPGVAQVLRDADKRRFHLDHERSGDLVCLSDPDAWFTYYYWLDDARAPDFARTVDIHRKPGYDPVELFTDASKLAIATKLLKRKLGFRTLLDVIPLDATLVKGSHGLPPRDPMDGAMIATNTPQLLLNDSIDPTAVCDLILRHIFD